MSTKIDLDLGDRHAAEARVNSKSAGAGVDAAQSERTGLAVGTPLAVRLQDQLHRSRGAHS